MIKTYIAVPLGAVALSMLFAQGANASCGNVVSRFSALLPEAEISRAQMNLAAPNALIAPPGGEHLEPTDPPSRIAGLWNSNVLVNGQIIFQAFEAFTGEGLEFLNDNGSPMEGNVCFGTWTAAPKNTIKVYHPSWNYDANGNLIGTVIIKTQITLDPGGNSFKGTVVVDTYDLNGKVAAPELQAMVTGNRVTTN